MSDITPFSLRELATVPQEVAAPFWRQSLFAAANLIERLQAAPTGLCEAHQPCPGMDSPHGCPACLAVSQADELLALRAVAEAARELTNNPDPSGMLSDWGPLADALEALDAKEAKP